MSELNCGRGFGGSDVRLLREQPKDRSEEHKLFFTILDGVDPSKEFVGLGMVMDLLLLCYFSSYRPLYPGKGDHGILNHVLLEGMNGTAKTRLARAVASALAGHELESQLRGSGEAAAMARIAGSPELTPTDIVGGDMVETKGDGASSRVQLRFHPGPLLSPFLCFYVDELNRSPPRSQTVLLEAMAEGQVTIASLDPEVAGGRRQRRIPEFWLIASQNPSSHEGTFPLPEAQLDRFMVKIRMPYPGDLAGVLEKQGNTQAFGDWESKPNARAKELEAWVGQNQKENDSARGQTAGAAKLIHDRILQLRSIKLAVQRTRVQPEVMRYIADMVYATFSRSLVRRLGLGIEDKLPASQRIEEAVHDVVNGVSVRGALALRDLARAYAWASGHDEVRDEHVETVAPFVLTHRISLADGVPEEDLYRVVPTVVEALRRRRSGGRVQPGSRPC